MRTASVEFIADVGEKRQLAFAEQLGQPLDQSRLLDLVGDLGDDDERPAVRPLLELPAGAQAQRTATGSVGLDARCPIFREHAARGEVRSRQQRHQVLDRRLRMLDQTAGGGANLGHVVRRDVGGHADGDPLGAVRQQVRESSRQHHRLLVLAVVSGAEVDRVLVEAVHQRLGDGGEPRLGVAHGGGAVAVDVAEVALPFDQRPAYRKVLGEPDQRLVDRSVAVRMIAADDVADDAGALLETGARSETKLPHRVQQTPVHRLQAVARVRQRPADNRRDRVGQIALGDRLAERDVVDQLGAGMMIGHAPYPSASAALRAARAISSASRLRAAGGALPCSA